MTAVEKEIQARLFALQDLKYRDFSGKLTPTVDPETVIGVRTPLLRAFAREYAGTPAAAAFLKILPHRYFEENNLHGFLIETIPDYDAALAALEAFLPYVDNWATCDLMSPKIFKKHRPEFYERVKAWLSSDRPYTVRFGVGMLMGLYLDDAFLPEMPELVARFPSEDYYVRMMVAWYFATALAKRPDDALPFIRERRLDKWTHNKAIQKALESRRVGDAEKADLRALKIL